jgi:hypothetical protein
MNRLEKSNTQFSVQSTVGITQWIQFSRFVAGAKDCESLPNSLVIGRNEVIL